MTSFEHLLQRENGNQCCKTSF